MLKEAPAEQIKILEGRVRQEFKKGDLEELAESFKKFGQIQPGVCVEEEGAFVLVAGERRLRACELAEIPFKFVLQEDADPLLLKEIELEENLRRVDLTWQEEIFGYEELHRLRQEQRDQVNGTKQTLMDTAEELKSSKSSLHRDLELAQWAKEFEEVAKAKTKAEAIKVVKKIRGKALREKFLREATEEASESEARVEDAPEKREERKTVEIAGKQIENEYLLELDRRVIHGKMEEKLNDFRDGSANIVTFDPPWGVSLDSVRKKGPGTIDFPDDPSMFFENLESWLSLLFRKMAKNAHLYMFFGIANESEKAEGEELSLFLGPVYGCLEKVGFVTNRIPLIWYKQGAHVTRNPEIWPGRSYEPIAYGRKGNKPLVRLGAPDVIITPAPTPSMKKIHPAAKHPDVYLELLKRSAEPGDTVLDPMGGSGMMGVAAEVLRHTYKLDWWMIEKEKAFRDLAVMNVLEGYSSIVEKGRGSETSEKLSWGEKNPLKEDFRKLEPGNHDWKRYWKKHPEEQEEMLAWVKERREKNEQSV